MLLEAALRALKSDASDVVKTGGKEGRSFVPGHRLMITRRRYFATCVSTGSQTPFDRPAKTSAHTQLERPSSTPVHFSLPGGRFLRDCGETKVPRVLVMLLQYIFAC